MKDLYPDLPNCRPFWKDEHPKICQVNKSEKSRGVIHVSYLQGLKG